MKNIFFFILLLILFPFSILAQCGAGTCPVGAISTLPSGGIIAAGTTYCISGTISNTTAYTVNGTLIIQSGSVTIGDLNVGKTGSIIVQGGARLMANSYTGESTAPASAISNMTICTDGYLYLSGAVNPGETNFTVNDNGIFVIHGSWSTIIRDTWFRLGMGATVEMCNPFIFNSSTGFFTETSSGPSYLVTRSSMANGAGSGYLSTSGAASQIKWAIPGGPVAWVTHPAANTCIGPDCGPVLPPGTIDNGLCGSVANAWWFIVLPLQFVDVEGQFSGENLLITVKLGSALPAAHIELQGAADGAHFIPAGYTAVAGPGNSYQFILPAIEAANYYRIKVTGDNGPFYSKVLPPIKNDWPSVSGKVRIFPVPATSFVHISVASNEKIKSAVLINSIGKVFWSIPWPAGTPVVHCELPYSLPEGIYFIRLVRMDNTYLTVRILKKL